MKFKEFMNEEISNEEVLNENIKYPTLQEAEDLINLLIAFMDLKIYTGTSEISSLRTKISNMIYTHYTKIFNEKTPWEVDKRKRKWKVVWDNNKAKKLGIQKPKYF